MYNSGSSIDVYKKHCWDILLDSFLLFSIGPKVLRLKMTIIANII